MKEGMLSVIAGADEKYGLVEGKALICAERVLE